MNIKDAQKRGGELFESGYNCAQAVFAAIAPQLGVDEVTALKTAAMFGGGVARTGGMCGALTGMLMAVGVNRASAETSAKIKAELYERGQALINAFVEMNGSINCRDLIGCDLSTKEGRESASARNVHENICVKLIREAIKLAGEK